MVATDKYVSRIVNNIYKILLRAMPIHDCDISIIAIRIRGYMLFMRVHVASAERARASLHVHINSWCTINRYGASISVQAQVKEMRRLLHANSDSDILVTLLTLNEVQCLTMIWRSTRKFMEIMRASSRQVSSYILPFSKIIIKLYIWRICQLREINLFSVKADLSV